jgi:hypothetical protein
MQEGKLCFLKNIKYNTAYKLISPHQIIMKLIFFLSFLQYFISVSLVQNWVKQRNFCECLYYNNELLTAQNSAYLLL